jgi:transcriptional regulator with XRE-family HTH domain
MARPRDVTHHEVKNALLPTAHVIQAARQRLGLTQQQLAAHLGIHTSVLARYELGMRSVPHFRLAMLATLLGSTALVQAAAAVEEASVAAKFQQSELGAALLIAGFDGRHFSAWWIERCVEWTEAFDVRQTDLESGRTLLVQCLASSIRLRERDLTSVNSDDVIRIASAFLPAITQALRDTCDARTADAT